MNKLQELKAQAEELEQQAKDLKEEYELKTRIRKARKEINQYKPSLLRSVRKIIDETVNH